MTESLSVLLVEDSPAEARLFREMLRDTLGSSETMRVVSVGTLADARGWLKEHSSDVVVLDLGLPDSRGLDTLRALRSTAPDVPVVVLTGLDDETMGLEAIRSGAYEYLIKGRTDGRSVTRTLRYAVEQQRALEALRESEARLRALLDNSFDGVALLDETGLFRFVANSSLAILGYSPHALLGTDGLSLVHPEDASAAYEALAGCLAHPRTLVRTRERLRHADGTWRWVDTTAKNMLDEPAVGGLVLNFRDVTEQVELEREQIALRDASAELLDTLNVAELATKVCRIAVERMGLSLVWVGYAGEDGSVTALAGWPDIPPHIVAAPVRWDDTPRGHGPTGEAIRTLTPVVCENVETDSKFDAWRQGALARGIRSSAAIPLNSRDRRFGVLSVYSDVTGFFTPGRMDTFIAYAHHAASALENARLYEELAHELAERKRIEGQLQQAQKMEAVGRLAGGIAQDFNNLLTAIIGHSELARDAARPGSQLEVDLKEVLKAADRATSLTKQLLALGSRQAVSPQCLSLASVVKDMQRVLPPLLGDRIQIEITLNEQLPDVLADRPQIEQVVVNLAVNARDAMPDGGTVRMAVEGVTAPGPDAALQRWVSLVVSDTGCGMDGETVAKIFEPFFTTKERGKGTGLGLSTVYGIVKQSRGQITVDSAPGRGTTFRILLPAQP